MKTLRRTVLACLLTSMLITGCDRTDKEALAKIIDSCEPGGTATIRGTLSTWGNKIEITCVWIKKEEK